VIVRNLFRLVLVCAVTAVSGYGQNSASTASISGTVRDAAGQAIPGAHVRLRELTTNQTRQATSGADGSYRVSVLPVGTYEVRAESAGFAPYLNPQVTLAVGSTATLDITLKPAGVNAEITVTDRPPSPLTHSRRLLTTPRTSTSSPLTLMTYRRNAPFHARTCGTGLSSAHSLTCPSARRKRRGNNGGDDLLGTILGHVEVAPIVTVSSGRPVNPLTGADEEHSRAFPLASRPLGFARDSFSTPRFINFDLRAVKYFPFGEKRRLDLVVEFFNVFNHPNVTGVNQFYGSGAVPLATFDAPTLFSSPRQVRLSIDFEF
jgi:hypothetical protein